MRRDAELRQMRLWIHDRLPPDAQLWIDQTFAGRGDVSMTQGLSQTIAAVMTAHDWIHEPIIVHSSTWKAQVIGNHQAAKDVGRDLVVEAWSEPDRIVEALRWSGPSYVFGVQWHPEFHDPADASLLDDTPILDDFLARARH